MTDFETRLRDSLAHRAEDAPAPTGLAVRARGRLQRRRAAIAKVVAGVVAGAAVIAAVPLGIALVEGADVRPRPRQAAPVTPFIVPDLSPEIRTPRETKREIKWAGITFEVPSDWKAGATTAWCAKGKPPGGVVPRIDLPDQERPGISCTPTSGYGVRVTPAAGFEPDHSFREVWEYAAASGTTEEYPEGAWVSYWYDDDWVVTTATPDPGMTSRITRSVRGKVVDVNGCALVLEDDADLLEKVGAHGVGASRCRYAWDGDLQDSARLTEREADRVLDALAAASEIASHDGCVQEQGWVVTLTPAGQRPYLVRYGTLGLGSCKDGVEFRTADQQGSPDRLELTTELAEALALNPDDLSVD